MKKSTKIIMASIVVALLVLGIGYAAIQNITLNIGGTLEADPNQANFNVRFIGTPTVSIASKVTASIESDTSAKIEVKDLTTVGESVKAEYTVENASADLSADLAVATTNSNTEYFTIKAELEKTSLTAGETTKVTVTATLTKAPISKSVTAEVDVDLTAIPVEPGKEGSSGLTNGSSESPIPTLAKVTNNNIGDYIDLGNNIVGEEVTTDDWRVLYVENGKVYAILADYLPASQIPASSGLETKTTDYQYSVWSSTDRTTLLNGLLDETAWSSFANEISGTVVTGAPTAELIMNSYNTKNGTELIYTDSPKLDSSKEDYDLYVPQTEIVSNCSGYWLATSDVGGASSLWRIAASGGIFGRNYAYSLHNSVANAARPVVELPASTTAELVDGVWTVSK